MIIPISFPSAAAFWLNYCPEFNTEIYGDPVDLPDLFHLPGNPYQANEILKSFKYYYPLSVFSPRIKRNFSDNNIIHTLVYPANIPPKSFIMLQPDIYVASPEYCFLQAARDLSLEQLILFGNELCGKYVHDNENEFKQRSRIPVTTAEKIKRFLKNANKCYGYRKAKQASNYILNNSNSFMESMLAAFIRMPLSMGGYALKIPDLNKEAVLSDLGNKIMHGYPCLCDIVWEAEKLIVEYDSDISHLSSYQHARDKQRSSALAASGYRVISITKRNVEFLSSLDETFITIRKLLGMKIRTNRISQYADKRRRVLASFRNYNLNIPCVLKKQS